MAEPESAQPPTRGSSKDWVRYLSQVEMPVLSDLFQPPDREQFQAFSHFVQQAQLCLNNLSEKG